MGSPRRAAASAGSEIKGEEKGMTYKKFQELELSDLGMGCMRLPYRPGGNVDIDEAATAQMVDYAMANGVNYYGTAWVTTWVIPRL